MKKNFLLLTIAILLVGCVTSKQSILPKTLEHEINVESNGYQPLDPLPVYEVVLNAAGDTIGKGPKIGQIPKVENIKIMATLPDETMRLAIGQVNKTGSISFGATSIGYKDSNYIIVLDYIKFDTKSLTALIKQDDTGNITDFKSITTNKPDTLQMPFRIIPVYVGVGLRFTATIHVLDGNVNLSNLFGLGLAAESNKINGTLVIQTLGISGQNISTLIPMPSQLNTTTIQNAIMALAAIKAKIYEADAEIHPRIIGFYNNFGGGQKTINRLISSVLSGSVTHVVRM
ncbi:hypothetical protein CLV51_1058 [Chitinophaga niastensis]|uniref:Uncharacterized protein n=1 Tax=Chitinophaga niastensis TaxID=536980 RepID=A0A2P8HEH5_CHINA|nr:hypothetical protein [Chitinophaga niastensis]PSL44636.1 hypothetical protein CLV51_1058 [Chitinophaga niastensis]